MLHTTTELYRVYNNHNKYAYATLSYVQANNIPIEKDIDWRNAKRYGKPCAVAVEHYSSPQIPAGRTMTINTPQGLQKIYFLGYSWYDTEEERNEEEAFRDAEALLNRERKSLLSKFENMTLEELRQVVAQLDI